MQNIFRMCARFHWHMITNSTFTVKVILLTGLSLTLLLLIFKSISKNNKMINDFTKKSNISILVDGTPTQTIINGILVTVSASVIAYIFISFNNAHVEEFKIRAKAQRNCNDLFILANKTIPGI